MEVLIGLYYSSSCKYYSSSCKYYSSPCTHFVHSCTHFVHSCTRFVHSCTHFVSPCNHLVSPYFPRHSCFFYNESVYNYTFIPVVEDAMLFARIWGAFYTTAYPFSLVKLHLYLRQFCPICSSPNSSYCPLVSTLPSNHAFKNSHKKQHFRP